MTNKSPEAAKQFGSYLRSTRSRSGESQREWAEKAGIDPTVLSRIERGQYLPPRSQVLQWSTSWGLPSDVEDRLMVEAKFLPRLPDTLLFTHENMNLLNAALREVLAKSPEVGFTEILKKRIKNSQ